MATNSADHDKFRALCSKTYKDQAVWFLNAYWHKYQGDAETLWKHVHKLAELDLQKRAAGNELDELNAHRFLEFFNETMTVQELRNNLRSTGAIGPNDKPKMVPYIHYLIFKYKLNWHELVNASQGDNKEEVEEAQRRLDQVQAAFRESEQKAAEAKASHQAAEARAREAEQREAESRQAQAELEAALAELKAQEEAYNRTTQELKRKSEDESIGLVTRNKAKNELAQHLAGDTLPLKKAKITQEAAVKKADKATQAAADARAAAERAAAAAAKDKEAAEAAVAEAMRRVEEAERYLEEVKAKPGSAQGALWWIDRELHEAKAYMPEKKGGYRKQK